MKHLSLMLLLLSGFFWGQAQSFQWAKKFGGIDHDNVNALTSDLDGNVYIVGWFRGTVDVDPGPAVYNLTSVGLDDMYISKFDSSGHFIWAAQFDNASNCIGRSIVCDSSYNLYISGYFNASIDADPGPGMAILNALGASDLFILKLDSAGHFLWVKQIGGSGSDGANSLLIDKHQELCIAGYFQNTVDFDPDAGLYYLSGTSPSFILKLTLSGQFINAKSFNDNGSLDIYLQADASDNILITCLFNGTRDFDPGPSTYYLTSAGSYDVAALKLDHSLQLLWAKRFGGASSDISAGIEVDSQNNAYVVGRFSSQADFDPGAGVFSLTSSGGYDIFLLKLDSMGNFIWAKGIGGINDDVVYAIHFDQDNLFYITGNFKGTVDFDPGANQYDVIPLNSTDNIFIAKFTSGADLMWAACLGSGQGVALHVDTNNNLLIAGQFFFTPDFDPGPGVYNLTSAGASDCYVLKLGHCGSNDTSLWIHCDSVQWYGNTYTSSGYYLHAFSDIDHCDSNQVLHLTINHASAISFVDSACDAYLFNGQTFTNSGLYHDTLMNAAGCDSVITLALSIYHPTISNINITACDSLHLNGVIYTSGGNYTQHLATLHGCDSTLYLHLTMHHATSAAILAQGCKMYTLNGLTYTSSGTYVQTLTNALGCDSVLTLQLNITNLNTSVAQSANSLWSNSPAAVYQWVNCKDFIPIPGATNQGYTTLTGGSFAVIVTQYGCTDTSACYSVFSLGMDSLSHAEAITLYPNPTKGVVFIQSEINLTQVSLLLYNELGEMILKQEDRHGRNFVIDLSSKPSGIYFLRMISDGIEHQIQIIKE